MTKQDRLGQNTPYFSVKNSIKVLIQGVFCPHSPKNYRFQTLTVGKPVLLCLGFRQGWAVHVYDSDRHLRFTLEPSHIWAFSWGIGTGILMAIVCSALYSASHSFSSNTNHLKNLSPTSEKISREGFRAEPASSFPLRDRLTIGHDQIMTQVQIISLDYQQYKIIRLNFLEFGQLLRT